MTIVAILLFIGAVIWGVMRIVHFQDYQYRQPMIKDGFQCSWHEYGFSYAGVAIRERAWYGWKTVYRHRNGWTFGFFEHATPSDLRNAYSQALAAYIRYRDAWNAERGAFPTTGVEGRVDTPTSPGNSSG